LAAKCAMACVAGAAGMLSTAEGLVVEVATMVINYLLKSRIIGLVLSSESTSLFDLLSLFATIG
jgi:hypothetical protein